nr:MAG TPA: hypothetical protein [Caudoviricetes sp.]
MLENIQILDRYDDVPKNRGQMSLFLEEVTCILAEMENKKGIALEDYYCLCDWDYVVEDIYEKYRDLVNDETLFKALGLCKVLGHRSALTSMLDDEEARKCYQ